MAVHLLSFLREQFTPSVIDQLSGELNETPANIKKTVDGALPTLLGGLTRRVQASGGASGIIDFLEKRDYGRTPLAVAQVTDAHQETVETSTQGQDFLRQIFGSNLDRAVDVLGQHSGVKPLSALTVLSLAGSVLMGILGRQEQDKGLTASNLTTLLLGQADEFRTSLPRGLEGIATLLGFDKLHTPAGPQTEVQGADNFTSTVINPNIPKSPEGDRRRENVRWLRWAMVALGVLVVGLIVQKCREDQDGINGVYTDTTRATERDAVEDTSAATKENIRGANGQVADSTAPGALGIRDEETNASRRDVELPGGRRLNLVEGSFNAQLAEFLASKPTDLDQTFTFENLTFETNSARISAESQPNVNDLIQIMEAYPSLNIRIEGHTDNTGNAAANKQLSLDRANAVKSAITAAGIQANRITTQGFGSTKPTASNDTPDGREQNRRIDVVVTKL